jgi:hypothetical protein
MMVNPAIGWLERGARREESRRWKESLRPGIERDTELMPWLIADSVLQEAGWYLGVDLPAEWSDWLDGRAERVYVRHAHFRSMIRGRGNSGRDVLYRFFRHWLAGRLKRERYSLFQRLPVEFGLGVSLRPRRTVSLCRTPRTRT